MKSITRYIRKPSNIIYYLINKNFFCFLSDKMFIKLFYRVKFGRKINLDNPKTFNEKLQWLKLYDRKEIYTKMVDKCEVKKLIKKLIGEEYVINTLGVYDKFNEINFDKMPSRFVIKCTHDSSGIIIVKDKSSFNKQNAEKKINELLKRNYYNYGREWPYKNVKPRIIIEEYMEDNTTAELRDYKFFCFNGEVKFFKIDFDRFKNHRANYYDLNGNILSFGEEICPPDFKKKITMPYNLKRMVKLSETLAKETTFIRVDFYEVDKRIYFGELTFYPASGFGKFVPNEYDEKIGNMLKLKRGDDK